MSGMSAARHTPFGSLDSFGPHNPVTTLGRAGLRLNTLALALGPYDASVDAKDFAALVKTYTEAGGATFDLSGDDLGHTADAFAPLLADELTRDEVVLIARSGRRRGAQAVGQAHGDTSRRGLMSHLDTTLARLGTEHVDVWLVDGVDGITPAHEIASTMHWAVESGRATYVGLARCDAWQAVDVAHHLRARGHELAAHAVSYSLLERDAETSVRDAANALGYGVLGARPLAAGALTGKYRHATPADSRLAGAHATTVKRFLQQRHRRIIESLATAADGLGVHPTELALAWTLQSNVPDVVAVGARTTSQLKVCQRALELNLPAEIITVLDEISAAR